MAFSLRLPEELEQRARERAQAVGISLNAMVCVALDAYLRAGIPLAQHGTKPPEPEPKAPEPAERVAQLQQRQPLPSRSWQPDPDPKPVLPPNPTKADRTRLAQWYERNKAL